jgi:hypothetical protein
MRGRCLLFILVFAAVGRAEDGGAGTVVPSPTPAPGAPPPSDGKPSTGSPSVSSPPTIASISTDGFKSETTTGEVPCSLGNTLQVRISSGGLAAMEATAASKRLALGLLIDGHYLRGPTPLKTAADELSFHITRGERDEELWNEVLGGDLFHAHVTTLDLGLENGVILTEPSPNKLVFQPLDGSTSVFVGVLGLLFVAVTCTLAVTTNMLRDAVGALRGITWSLGRVQMAFWFVNILLAFLVIWVVTGAAPAVTTTMLTLLGIGAGTALGASIIDVTAQAQRPPPPGKESAEPPGTPVVSKGFFLDILMEDDTISLHRYQMVVWTLVLGGIFWGSVWHRLAMPELPSTLLALQGITAGTYLGFKLPSAAPVPPQPPAN